MRYVLRAVGSFGRWSAVAVAAVTAVAAVVAVCLHLLVGLSTATSVIMAAVLGGLALGGLALGAAAVVWLAGAAARLDWHEPLASPAVLTPGNLPHLDAADGPVAADDDTEVWE